MGVLLTPNTNPKLATVDIQYSSSRTQKWCSLKMPLLDALYLLNLLEGMSVQHGFEAMRREPGKPK